jgi:ABC-2 type transport system ATP-binding protein
MADSLSDDVVIRVTDLSKSFRMAGESSGSIKAAVVNPIAAIRNRRKKPEVQRVLKGINIEIKTGEFFGVVGRNGSGKSTLLKILAGIYQPTKGSVTTKGRVVPFIEFGVGFNGELTGRENIYLNGAVLGFSRKEVDKRIDDIISFSELQGAMEKKLKNYSSGMQVRLAFSIATRLAESDILLIDEVLAVGDADFQRKCFDYFRGLKKQHKTVLLITHDMSAVRQYCDRAILIDKGKVAIAGSQEDVAAAYTRMFQEEDMEIHDVVASERWGSAKIDYSDIKISQRVLNIKDKFLTVTCEAESHIDAEDAVFGISVMNSIGEHLFGSNNNLRQKRSGEIHHGDKITVEWQLPNIMNEGHYSVCPTISLPNGEVCDNWNEARQFRVYKEFSTGFPVDPELEITMTIHKAGV